jgi:hypothetical protein
MRASLLALVLALVATSACTQGNVQLPPAYDASGGSSGDGSMLDASEDVTPTGDGASEAAADAPVSDAPVEGSSEGGSGEGGSTDAGSTGDGGAGD